MQLTSYENIKENVIFCEPKEFEVKDSKLKYFRIKIEAKFSNGKKAN